MRQERLLGAPTLAEICEPEESVWDGGWTRQNPTLVGLLDETLHREPLPAQWRDTLHAVELVEKYEQASTVQVRQEFYQRALELHDELETKRGPRYLEHARVRAALASYLEHEVAPWARANREHDAIEYYQLAGKLERARQWGVYGVNWWDDSLVVEWNDRAGLVKLCPDDAREEAARVSGKYAPMIEALQEAGAVVRYAVFTIPNVPRWHLGAGLDAIFNRFRDEILYARTDGRRARSLKDPKRRFPHLLGALATVEDPLSRHGDWNVHLNVLMVFAPPPDNAVEGQWSWFKNGSDRELGPDYEALRAAWAANVEFKVVPTGAGDAALRELIKYPLKAISLKSQEKRAAGRSAPPTIEWPPDAFVEWWRAHKGFRRTRSWGVLYAAKVPEAGPPLRNVDYLGKVTLSPARFRASMPIFDTRTIDALQAARAARSRHVDSILGNKSAGFRGASGPGPPVN